jgi:PAS domain S-box-containing protein
MPEQANDLRQILDGARDYGIVALSPDGTIQVWSDGAEKLFGYTGDEVIGKSSQLIFTPEDRAIGEFDREITIAATEGRAEDDRWHLRKDGSRFWASGVVTALRDGPGTVKGFVKVIRDKTDERRLQENLRLSEEQFARLFIANPAAVAVERRDTETFVIANEAFFSLVGYWRSEVMGRTGRALRLWADPQQRKAAIDYVVSDGACKSTRLDLRTKAGEVVSCRAALASTMMNEQDCIVMTFVPE